MSENIVFIIILIIIVILACIQYKKDHESFNMKKRFMENLYGIMEKKD